MPLPPYAPELNSVENVWDYLRSNFLSHRVWETYDEIVDACCDRAQKSPERRPSPLRHGEVDTQARATFPAARQAALRPAPDASGEGPGDHGTSTASNTSMSATSALPLVSGPTDKARMKLTSPPIVPINIGYAKPTPVLMAK